MTTTIPTYATILDDIRRTAHGEAPCRICRDHPVLDCADCDGTGRAIPYELDERDIPTLAHDIGRVVEDIARVVVAAERAGFMLPELRALDDGAADALLRVRAMLSRRSPAPRDTRCSG